MSESDRDGWKLAYEGHGLYRRYRIDVGIERGVVVAVIEGLILETPEPTFIDQIVLVAGEKGALAVDLRHCDHLSSDAVSFVAQLAAQLSASDCRKFIIGADENAERTIAAFGLDRSFNIVRDLPAVFAS